MTNLSKPYHVCVVCTGNICRSPMGEVMLRHAIHKAGLEEYIFLNSCGTGHWHQGDPADPRALAQLSADGYDGSTHRASGLGTEHIGADLFLAMDQGHTRELRKRGISPDSIRLFRSFDSDLSNLQNSGSLDIADPYYENQAAFSRVSHQISTSLPGIIDFLREEIS